MLPAYALLLECWRERTKIQFKSYERGKQRGLPGFEFGLPAEEEEKERVGETKERKGKNDGAERKSN